MNGGKPTVGVLYAGEMGASLAALLQSRGARVVTTVEGRGERTLDRCRGAGLALLDSFDAVARESSVVVSLVPPDIAETIAARYARVAPAGSLFVDANSIRPELVRAFAKMFQDAGIGFVDASINGLAKNLTHGGTLFLSGERANEIAGLFGDSVRVKILGSEPGRASAMKMLLGGLSKGTCALFLELAIVARREGMLAEMLEATEMIYPGIAALVDRMLPTYARHAPRRAVEIGEVEAMARSAGMEPCVIEAVHQLHERLATVRFEGVGADDSLTRLIEYLDDSGLLQ